MSFGKIVLTNKGQALWAKAVAGSQLKMTRMMLGDGELDSGASVSALTGLVSSRVSIKVAEIIKGSNYATLSASFKNSGMVDTFTGDGQTLAFALSAAPTSISSVKVGGSATTAYSYQSGMITFQSAPAQDTAIEVTYNLDGFYWREIGIMAQDPDEGEILFAYQNAYTQAEYIPGSLSETVEKIIKLRITLTQVRSVTFAIDDSILYMPASRGQEKTELLEISTDLSEGDYLPVYRTEAKKGARVSVTTLLALIHESMSSAFNNMVTGVKGSAESTYRNGNVNITAANIGLGNVPNKATNDQTPTFEMASTLTELVSGAKLTENFAKLAKAVVMVMQHETGMKKKGNTQTTRVTNASIPASSWATDTTFTDYPYKAVLSITGVKATMECKTFLPDHTNPDLTYLFAPWVNTGAGILEVWANEKPSGAITIELITFEEVLS